MMGARKIITIACPGNGPLQTSPKGEASKEYKNLLGLNLIDVICSPDWCTAVKASSSKPFIFCNELINVAGTSKIISVMPQKYCNSPGMINALFLIPKSFVMKRLALLFTCTVLSLSFVFAQADKTFPDSWTDGQYYTVNGAKLWVVTVGKGEPLILIAGGPGGAHPGLRSFDSLSMAGIYNSFILTGTEEENRIQRKM